jgi:hypothetical protein
MISSKALLPLCWVREKALLDVWHESSTSGLQAGSAWKATVGMETFISSL